MTTTSATPPAVSRRDFLKLGWSALVGLATLEAGAIALSYSLPRIAAGEFGSVFNCGAVADFPNNTVTPFNAGRFYLVRLSDGGFLALYRRCTHLGCAVPWDPTQKQFVCPCHASAFDQTGNVLNTPAPRPLDLFPVSIADGRVLVDTGRTIERERFEPEQAVYVN